MGMATLPSRLSVLLLGATGATGVAGYPGNFALQFLAKDGDILRVPHESSMQGPLIDSFTVELWLKVEPNSQLDTGRIVNLIGFPGRHPFLGLASDTGCATIQLKTANNTWYSYEGTTPVDDGHWHHVAATWDGTQLDPLDRKLALYVDGVLEAAGGEEDDATEVPKTPVRRRCRTSPAPPPPLAPLPLAHTGPPAIAVVPRDRTRDRPDAAPCAGRAS